MHYHIFTGGEKNTLFSELMEDVRDLPEVTLVDALPRIPAGKQKIWKLLHNTKLNQKMTMPFREMFYKYMPFEEKVLAEGEHCLIFNNVSAPFMEPGLLKKWKKRYGIKLVFYFLDVYDSYYAKDAGLLVKKVPFDKVYTFYQEDAKKYGFTYFDSYYSRLEIPKVPVSQKVFFWGTDGGRRAFVEDTAKHLGNLSWKYDFGICYTEGEGIDTNITYNKPLAYKEVLKRLAACDVLLDVVGEYSKGVSLRYYESFAFGKKLITNNPLAKQMRGYDPERIFVIERPEDITEAFLQKDSPPEEKTLFSPTHFIKELNALWGAKNKE